MIVRITAGMKIRWRGRMCSELELEDHSLLPLILSHGCESTDA
jgi:hypothetical protein